MDRDGFVNANEAVQFFSKSGLSQDALATVWSVVHINNSKRLNKNAFAISMRLISLAQNGRGITLEAAATGTGTMNNS